MWGVDGQRKGGQISSDSWVDCRVVWQPLLLMTIHRFLSLPAPSRHAVSVRPLSLDVSHGTCLVDGWSGGGSEAQRASARFVTVTSSVPDGSCLS